MLSKFNDLNCFGTEIKFSLIKFSLMALILCETGCAWVSQEKKSVVVRRPQASISGLFVKDQILDIPEVGLTAGEALGLAFEDSAAKVNDPDFDTKVFSALYLTIARADEVLYIPLALVKDHVASNIQIKPGDRLSVVHIERSQWKNDAQPTLPKITLTGLISRPSIAASDLTALIDEVYVGDDQSSWGNKLEGAATVIQLRRVIDGKVHRLVVPTKIVGQASLITTDANRIRSNLGVVALLDGDLLEFTDVNLIPDIQKGRAAMGARSVLEQARARRQQCLSRNSEDAEKSSEGFLSTQLEPIKRRLEATRRLFPRP